MKWRGAEIFCDFARHPSSESTKLLKRLLFLETDWDVGDEIHDTFVNGGIRSVGGTCKLSRLFQRLKSAPFPFVEPTNTVSKGAGLSSRIFQLKK
jgi:hypothetical protein